MEQLFTDVLGPKHYHSTDIASDCYYHSKGASSPYASITDHITVM